MNVNCAIQRDPTARPLWGAENVHPKELEGLLVSGADVGEIVRFTHLRKHLEPHKTPRLLLAGEHTAL